MKDGLVEEGDRFLTTDEFPTGGLAIYSAPYSSGFECVVPTGTTLIANQDQVKGAPSFICIPENHKQLEPLLVPESEMNDHYLDYYLVCRSAAIGDSLKPISD
jgi:hypothetical protein